jgi:hypothetical protein
MFVAAQKLQFASIIRTDDDAKNASAPGYLCRKIPEKRKKM